MNFPRVLRKSSEVMSRANPDGIIESLPVDERLIEIEVLQWIQLWNRGARSGGKRGAIRRRNSQCDRVQSAGLELVFSGEPEVVPESVLDRTIRPAELECVVAPEPGQIIFELVTILADDIWGAEGAAKSPEAGDERRRAGRFGRGRHSRIIGRELPAHLIDQIAPKTVDPCDDGRVVAVGQARAD